MLKIATTGNCGIKISVMMGSVNMCTFAITPKAPTRLDLDPHRQKHLLGALLLAVLLKLVMIPKAALFRRRHVALLGRFYIVISLNINAEEYESYSTQVSSQSSVSSPVSALGGTFQKTVESCLSSILAVS